MCTGHGEAPVVMSGADGDAVDPITLLPVDEVAITVLVDNSFDPLLPRAPGVERTSAGVWAAPTSTFEGGTTRAGLIAEHGFSALVTVRRGASRSTLLFDTGISPDGMATNAERLGIDFEDVRAVVLSHGHFDHAGGFDGLLRLRRRHGLPLTVHPAVWTRRRIAVPGADPFELPVLSARSLADEGFEVIERRQPSLLLEGTVLVTGEVDRTTEFERGMPATHQAWDGSSWQHDPLVIDDQALVVNVAGKGLVVVTGCGHAGAVNIARHAMRLTGVGRLSALIGGFHLGGSAFEPIIEPTVAALRDLAPDLVVPGHCTGLRAQHSLATGLPDAWAQSSAGSTYRLDAA